MACPYHIGGRDSGIVDNQYELVVVGFEVIVDAFQATRLDLSDIDLHPPCTLGDDIAARHGYGSQGDGVLLLERHVALDLQLATRLHLYIYIARQHHTLAESDDTLAADRFQTATFVVEGTLEGDGVAERGVAAQCPSGTQFDRTCHCAIDGEHAFADEVQSCMAQVAIECCRSLHGLDELSAPCGPLACKHIVVTSGIHDVKHGWGVVNGE